LTIFPYSLKLDLFADDIRNRVSAIDSLDYMFQYLNADNAEHFTDKMLYSDVMTYLPENLLVKIDRMTMAHGLEGRSPFLDHQLMGFVATIPPQYKLWGNHLKVILKEIANVWLPEKIRSRKKQGFIVPIGRWFQNELHDMIHDIFFSSSLVKEGILNRKVLQRILSEHQTGKINHHHRIWVLLNLELWYRMFIRNA
jgi:asparagine synthase (glutamine-hydrolysing)